MFKLQAFLLSLLLSLNRLNTHHFCCLLSLSLRISFETQLSHLEDKWILHEPFFLFFPFFFFGYPTLLTRGILVPQTGMGPEPCAVDAWGLNHWTAREVKNPSKIQFPHLKTPGHCSLNSSRLHWPFPLLPSSCHLLHGIWLAPSPSHSSTPMSLTGIGTRHSISIYPILIYPIMLPHNQCRVKVY